MLNSTQSWAQTTKAPVNVTFIFDHAIDQKTLTDYYELCQQVTPTVGCYRIAVNDVIQNGPNPGTWSFNRQYLTGPFTVALRACNANGCSNFGNPVTTPTVVSASPGIPTNTRIIVVIPTP